ADPIEIAGDQVDQLYQPLTERAEELGRNTHAPIADRLVLCCKISRQLANLLGWNTATGAHRFGAESGYCRAYFFEAVQREFADTRQAFVKQGVEQAEQQRRVLSGAHEQVLISDCCGLAAPRVNHYQLAATGTDRLQSLLHVGYGHDAAVGGQRV